MPIEEEKKIEDMSLDALVDKFLQKDSIMLTPNERVTKRREITTGEHKMKGEVRVEEIKGYKPPR